MYCMTIAVTTAAMIGLSTTLKNSHMRRIFFSRASASSISMRVRSSLRIRSSSNLFIKPSRRAMRSSMFIGTILLLVEFVKNKKAARFAPERLLLFGLLVFLLVVESDLIELGVHGILKALLKRQEKLLEDWRQCVSETRPLYVFDD